VQRKLIGWSKEMHSLYYRLGPVCGAGAGLHRPILRQNQLYKLNNNFGGIFHAESLQPGSHKSAFWTNPSRFEVYTRKLTIFVKRQIEDKCNFSRFYCNKNLS